MSQSNDQAGGASPSGPGTQGADNARAYVPPQTLKAKARPSDSGEGAKVQIKEGIDPRKAKTVAKGTLPTNTPVPPELVQHPAAVGHVGAPATPFEGAAAPAPPPRVDNALPFQPAPAAVAPAAAGPSGAPAAAAAPTNGVAAGGGFTPKHPPLQLSGPGVLTPMQGIAAIAAAPQAAPQASAPPAGAAALAGTAGPAGTAAPAVPAGAAAAPITPAPITPAPITPDVPQAAPSPVPGPAPEVSEPPAVEPSDPGGTQPIEDNVSAENAAEVVSGDGGAPQDEKPAETSGDDEHPLAATNSPWTAEDSVKAEDLPSADFLPSAQVSQAPEPAPLPAAEKESSGGSRTLMTVGLAVAAIALIGAVAYFTIIDQKSSSDDPAKVNVGSEQREYDMDDDRKKSEPKPSATPEVKPKPPPPKPKPVVVPKTIPKPRVPTPRKKPEDIYDGL